MTTGAAAGPSYRRDIDGLRAIAVLAVIGYHGKLPGFSGGYVGVDIFFVISGFLITQLILRELQAGRFQLSHFYERRFRRLMPALSLVLLACLVPAWLWMLPEQLTAFAVSAVAVVLMLPNVHFWRSIDYFNPGSEDFPLLHTWSLGIEEQFYIGFSLLLLLLWRVARRRIGLTLLLGTIASLVACEVFRRSTSVAAFYLLPFRAWELLLGGLAAQWHLANLVPQIGPAGIALRLRQSLPWLGFTIIAASIIGFDTETPFPGLWTLLPVAATFSLLLWLDAEHPVGRLLTCKPLVAIGLISYSAYLWHYPVFVFAELARLQAPGPLLTLVLILLALALAALSWRFVEQPARRQQLPFRYVAAAVALALSLVLGFAWWVWSGGGLPKRLPTQAVELLATAESRNPRQAECLSLTNHTRPPGQACLLGDSKRSAPSMVLMGDSHADALFDALDRRLTGIGLAARFMAFGGCPPVPGVFRRETRDSTLCNAFFSAAYDDLAAHPEIETVIVAARWGTYLEGESFDNGEGGREPGRAMVVDVLGDNTADDGDTERAMRLAKAYRAGIQRLLAMGKRVVLIYPVPEVGWHVPRWLALHIMRGRPIDADLSTSAALFERRNHAAMLALAGIKAAPGQLVEIHPSAMLCNTTAVGRCLAQIDGVPIYYDDNHLNLAGASKLVARIAAALEWPAGEGASGVGIGR